MVRSEVGLRAGVSHKGGCAGAVARSVLLRAERVGDGLLVRVNDRADGEFKERLAACYRPRGLARRAGLVEGPEERGGPYRCGCVTYFACCPRAGPVS